MLFLAWLLCGVVLSVARHGALRAPDAAGVASGLGASFAGPSTRILSGGQTLQAELSAGHGDIVPPWSLLGHDVAQPATTTATTTKSTKNFAFTAPDLSRYTPTWNDDREWTKTRIAACCLYSFLVMYVGWLCFNLARNYYQYRCVIAHIQEKHNDYSFRDYLSYRFSYWFTWDDTAKLTVLMSLALIVMMAGSTIYVISLHTTLGHACYVVFTILVEPDGGKQEKSWAGKAIAAVVSVLGLVIFAVLVAWVQQRFNTLLEAIREGRAVVVESNHIVILGWTEQSTHLLNEICEAHQERGGCKIAVLSEVPKPVMEEEISNLVNKRGSNIVVRAGPAHTAVNLRKVAAQNCRCVIVLSDQSAPEEIRDSMVMRALLTLRNEGWPYNDGRILLQVAGRKNVKLFEKIGGPMIDIVESEAFVGRIIVQCSRQVGMSKVVKDVLGFSGSEFYIQDMPEVLVGKRFREALYYFPHSVLAGVAKSTADTSVGGRGSVASATGKTTSFLTSSMGLGGTSSWSTGPSRASISGVQDGHTLTWFPRDYELKANDKLLVFADDDPSQMEVSDMPVWDYEATEVREFHVNVEDMAGPQKATLISRVRGAFNSGRPLARQTRGLSGSAGTHLDTVAETERTEESRSDSISSGHKVLSERRPHSDTQTIRRTVQLCNDDVASPDVMERLDQKKRSTTVQSREGHVMETVLLLGWNDTIWHILVELNASVNGRTRAVSYSQSPAAFRKDFIDKSIKYHNQPIDKLHIEYQTGPLGSRFHMESAFDDQMLRDVTRIFVLTDHVSLRRSNGALVDPDATIVPTILHMRQLLNEAMERHRQDRQVSNLGSIAENSEEQVHHDIPIIVEVKAIETEEHCQHIRVEDYIDSSALGAQVLAMIAYEPGLKDMLRDLVSERGEWTFGMRSLQDYEDKYDADEDVRSELTYLSFFSAQRQALKHDELLIGWSKDRAEEGSFTARASRPSTARGFDDTMVQLAKHIGARHSSFEELGLEWEMNPLDKTNERCWDVETDRLLVICNRRR